MPDATSDPGSISGTYGHGNWTEGLGRRVAEVILATLDSPEGRKTATGLIGRRRPRNWRTPPSGIWSPSGCCPWRPGVGRDRLSFAPA